jgi:methylglyoxal synthase
MGRNVLSNLRKNIGPNYKIPESQLPQGGRRHTIRELEEGQCDVIFFFRHPLPPAEVLYQSDVLCKLLYVVGLVGYMGRIMGLWLG